MREGSSVQHVFLPFTTLISMKFKSRLALLVATTVIFPALQAFAQEGPIDPTQPKGVTADEVIKRFAATEKEFKAALDLYAYRQTVKVQTVDGDTIDGEYAQTFDVTFDDQGHKVKTVVYAPESSLQRISMTQEDVDDIENRLPFVLTSDEIPEYDILYAGQQQEDELHCYVFDIAPKKIDPKRRYFQGRIWVDDRDLQIVKTFGKPVPETHKKNNENLFPKFTTWREQVDGKYWFPAYTKADDTLHFRTGGFQDVHIRDIIKYTDYKRYGSKTVITYEGKQLPGAQDQKPTDDQKPQ